MLCPTFAAAVSDPEISVPTALVMDRRTGEVIYSRNPDGHIAPASTTKVMTVLLAVEAVERGEVFLSDAVTATESAMQGMIADGSSAGIVPGETLTLEQLMYCAMIASANEACNIIAEHIAGSVSAFVSLMNERAKSLGCTDTHFANTHGLPDDQHYVTAADYGRIALEATRHPQFMKICGTSEIEIPASNVAGARELCNSNALICNRSIYGSDYVYEGASGIKTGHTNAAGYCLASTAARNGLEFIALVFGAPDSDTCFRDSATLLDWAFGNFSVREILKSSENIASVDVALGSDVDYVNLRPASSISALLPNDVELSEFQKDIRIYALESGETVTAPVAAGQVLGEASLQRAGINYGTVKLVASASVELSRMQYIRSQIRETTHRRGFRITVTVLVLLLLLYIVWVVLYRVRRIRYRRAVREANRPQSAEQSVPTQAVQPSAEPALAGTVSTAPPARSAAPSEEDLLRGAVKVAELKSELPAKAADDKAERDYFEEFFREK